MVGSPRGLTPRICSRPKHCWKSTALDDTLSSSWTGEGDLAALSRREVMLDNTPSSSTPYDGTGRPHAASAWQKLVLDGGRLSSPSGGGARRHRVVKALLCRCWMIGSRRIQS